MSLEPKKVHRKKVRVKTRSAVNTPMMPRLHLGVKLALALSIILVGGLVFILAISHQSAEIAVDMQSSARVQLPKDEGPHDDATEWWYYNGHLQAATGERFSYHVSLFARRAFVNHTLIHVSLLDHQTFETETVELRIPGFKAQEVKKNQFLIEAGAWSLALNHGVHKITGKNDTFALELDLSTLGPLVLQDNDGVIDFGPAGDSYYYSRTRMPTSGQLSLNGHQYTLTGQSWYDHQWGDFRASVLSWEWFGLQLDNLADVMLFALRDSTGQEIYVGGTYHKDGVTTHLHKKDFTMEPTGTWTSPLTKVVYPVNWVINIPAFQVVINLAPVKLNSEFDSRRSSYSAYWEGPLTIDGSHTGLGFLEVNTANAAIATPIGTTN